MEASLRYELNKAIPELDDKIYPTNAPEEALRPYLVYTKINTNRIKTLEGYTDKQALSYMFSIMATRYEDMKSLTNKVEDLLFSIPQKEIGIENIYIEDLSINNVHEVYEHKLGVNRGIIDFTIYF